MKKKVHVAEYRAYLHLNHGCWLDVRCCLWLCLQICNWAQLEASVDLLVQHDLQKRNT